MTVTDKNLSHGGPITPRQRADRYPANVTETHDTLRTDVLVRLPFLGAESNHTVSQPQNYGEDDVDETRDFGQHKDKAAEHRFATPSRGKRQRHASALELPTESLRRWGYPLGGVAVAVILVAVVYRALTGGSDAEPQDAVPWNQDEVAIQIPGLNGDSTDALTSIPSIALSEPDLASTAPPGQHTDSTDSSYDPAGPREYVATHTPSNSYDTAEQTGGHNADVPPGQSWNRTDEPSLGENGELTGTRPYWSTPAAAPDNGRAGSAGLGSTGPSPSSVFPGPTTAPEKLPPPSGDQFGPAGASTQPRPTSPGGIETAYPATPYPETDLSHYGRQPTPEAYGAESVRTARRPTVGEYPRDPNYPRDYARGAARLEQRIEQVPARGNDYERN